VDANGDSAGSCPIGRCAEIIAGKWTLLLIRDLSSGPRYFGDLETSLAGISPRTLCERLKFLAEQNVVTRTRIKGLPPRSLYELTDKGRALLPLLEAMRDYAETFLSGDSQLCEDPAASAVSAAVTAQPAP
jgi:DNA-binding HxlR family transcriptional regulator